MLVVRAIRLTDGLFTQSLGTMTPEGLKSETCELDESSFTTTLFSTSPTENSVNLRKYFLLNLFLSVYSRTDKYYDRYPQPKIAD